MNSQLLNSLNNHLQVSYGPTAAVLRAQPTDVWNYTCGKASRPVLEWRAELVIAASLIQGLFQKRPVLYVDGSFASQVMVQSFRWAHFPFSCVVPRFKDDLNLSSFSEAVLFLESISAAYEVVDLDLATFLSSPETLQWTKKYSTDLPAQLVEMQIWKQLSAQQLPMVFPNGLPKFQKSAEGWKVMEFEKDYGLNQFQKDQTLLGVPSFFKWSPELTMGFFKDPTLRNLMTNVRKETFISNQIYKEIFQNYFPIVGDTNWSGFEKAEMHVKRFFQAAKANFQGALSAYSFSFADYTAGLDFSAEAAAAMRTKANATAAGAKPTPPPPKKNGPVVKFA